MEFGYGKGHGGHEGKWILRQTLQEENKINRKKRTSRDPKTDGPRDHRTQIHRNPNTNLPKDKITKHLKEKTH